MSKTEILDFAVKWLGLFPWWALPLMFWTYICLDSVWDWYNERHDKTFPSRMEDLTHIFISWLLGTLVILWIRYV